MKKQFHKIKIAAENFSRQTKTDKNSEELVAADRHVEKYKEVLEKICRKFVQNPTSSSTNAADQDARDKRCKKVHEYKLAQSMEESLKDLPDGLLHDVLENCAKLEKNIAVEIVNNEINVENDVTKKLAIILENHIGRIQKQKRIVTKLMQDNESAKHKCQAAVRVNDSTSKINQLREEQEECEAKLEKERDIWAAEMFELIAEEDVMANHVINYIKYQQLYYKSALEEIEDVMNRINGLIKGNNRKVFKVPLEEHLNTTERTISYVIELCVCCLLEKGLFEEGLLRVGCAGSKLRRFRSALDANLITTPYPNEYQDVHVIASALKSYLRDLPEPLLTFNLYDQFIAASQRPTEEQRKTAILNALNMLPKPNYQNLRYLTKFLELLSQKHKTNKMTPQNIAIVMSPNLLWSPETGDSDYVSKVNSTASVNTIVEALVSDWTYYFGDDFAISDFYITISRDELFPHNGGFPVDRDFSTDNIMTKSLNIMPSVNNQQNHQLNQSLGSSSINSYQSHSRSSSHDTSLILIDEMSGSSDSLTKRSQSNSSLSDSSPPPQGSPKLPIRRKNTKKVAPTPPDNRIQRAAEHYSNTNSGSHQSSSAETMHAMKERFLNSCPPTSQDDTKFSSNRFLRNETKAQTNTSTFKPPSTPISMKQCSNSTENLSATKPDKPPRPAMPCIDSQTLVRNAFKSKGQGSERHSRPIALPRNLLNVARSTENLSSISPSKTSPSANSNDYNDIVQLRDRSNENNRNDKPAIPERPTSLMKSSNLRAAFEKFDSHQSILPDSPGGIKKTQSFRMSSTPVGNAIGSITGRSLTTLERTHIYSVDKKQIEIIDVDQQSNGSHSESSSNGKNSSSDKENDKDKDSDNSDKSNDSNGELKSNESLNDGNLLSTSTGNAMSSSTTNDISTVTQSPRCFEPKVIKRPQIPAPPPPIESNQSNNEPTQNRKSDTTAADFTKL
ncbi:rho GTPase-activating protein 21-like [Contarinia nasturtii]|uniref:rho GTPase-activating protein 21-like n=1 Tax=Contarinia nasturtii TaxID=265458 RepID=UPI0012D39BEA|nr:rho GTPase-activating protein 21-like [Contarinia nasturtii]XP_031621346.1 rho GTPase-activating protein 21-like [Contarinia nasturtii]